jgi:hypothetical protein
LKHFLIGLALCGVGVAATAQTQAPASSEAKARALRVSAALGACHARNAARLARSDPNASRVVDKVLAQCPEQENAVRAEVYRSLDATTAARVMRAQRAHWRRRVGELVARARARR